MNEVWRKAIADHHKRQRQQRGRRRTQDASTAYRAGMARVSPPTEDDGGVMGSMASMARCTHRACAVRWVTGTDHDCGGHDDSDRDWQARMDEFGIPMAAAPGDGDGDHDASTEGGMAAG